MYLEHFGLHRLPFEATSNGSLYVDLPEHREARNVVLFGLRSGEGFVKVVGEVGTGKTALCRAALSKPRRGSSFRSSSPDPVLRPHAFLAMVADELGVVVPITGPDPAPEAAVARGPARRRAAKDAGSCSSSMKRRRCRPRPSRPCVCSRISSRQTGKLLQIVLLGQPELDARLACYALRPLEQRIAFSARLSLPWAPTPVASTSNAD